jgi:Ca2+-binding EF-hand superfamily protein
VFCATAGLLLFAVAQALAGPSTPPSPVLLLPGAKEPWPLRVEVTSDGRSPRVAWDRFLDRFFDHFDADGDGALGKAEVGRMPHLPLAGGKELTLDFARLDAGRTGKVSRVRLKAYCEAGGFCPVCLVVNGPSADDLRLAAFFARLLERDGDGELTRGGLKRLPAALRRYDLNDDEYLSTAELLAGAEKETRHERSLVTLGRAAGERDPVLRVDLGRKPGAALTGDKGDRMKLFPPAAPAGQSRVRGPGGMWLTFCAIRTASDVAAARDFLVAQFKDALGDAPALSRAELQEDATLAGLVELFPFADRNGDGRLTLAELKGYLDLVASGVRAQVIVTVRDRGRNPFGFLDRDGDGRLSYREQAAAADLLGDVATRKGLPAQVELVFGGPEVRSWGGVALPAMKQLRGAAVTVRTGPAWFRALDRNGDGVVSPREWVGPPEVFRKLDANGDGVISPEEAAGAKRP